MGLLPALALGLAALAYARWTSPLRDADQALAAGNTAASLEAYAAAEARFGRFAATRCLFARRRADAIYNQLALLYRDGHYAAVIEKASTAPAGAAPRFWGGSALLARAVAEENPDARLRLAIAAEQELGQALRAAPDDWDTKYNYEMAARLAAGLRREPQAERDLLMKLLRPTPVDGPAPRKVG